MGFTKVNEQQEDCAWDAGFRSAGQGKHSIEAAHQLSCTCTVWCHLLRGERYPQDSAASVGPGLYILFLFTCTQEVVLGSAVTPIKGARLRSIRMHRPCLALPRLALPRLGDLYHYRYQRPRECCVHCSPCLYNGFRISCLKVIINRATPTRRHNQPTP